MENLIKVF